MQQNNIIIPTNLQKLKKEQLITIANQLGIKQPNTKNKDELIQLIKITNYNPTIITNTSNSKNNNIHKHNFNNVMNQLQTTIPKDKLRKVCKQCYELGHSANSNICKINQQYNHKIKIKIKDYVLNSNPLEDKTLEQIAADVSNHLQITQGLARSLLSEIPPLELIQRDYNLQTYLTNLQNFYIKCNNCNANIINLNSNTNRIWKNNVICDNCWFEFLPIRDQLWELIKAYKPYVCQICNLSQDNQAQRFHFDHFNMFDKEQSIANMVSQGDDIQDIYKQIDKCQVLCITCHHIVTDIEIKLGFHRVKRHFNKQLNNGDIDETQAQTTKTQLQEIYQLKMSQIYQILKQHFQNQ